jgi:hypothetical protein
MKNAVHIPVLPSRANRGFSEQQCHTRLELTLFGKFGYLINLRESTEAIPVYSS